MFCGPAVVFCSFILAQVATASHPKVTVSIRHLGHLRGERGGCKSRRVGEELVEWRSAVHLLGALTAASKC